jgi:hypothetical protein
VHALEDKPGRDDEEQEAGLNADWGDVAFQ